MFFFFLLDHEEDPSLRRALDRNNKEHRNSTFVIFFAAAGPNVIFICFLRFCAFILRDYVALFCSRLLPPCPFDRGPCPFDRCLVVLVEDDPSVCRIV